VNMTDEEMIATILRMQNELRGALQAINDLTDELVRRKAVRALAESKAEAEAEAVAEPVAVAEAEPEAQPVTLSALARPDETDINAIEEERMQVFNYMFDLQKSGVTNMLGCTSYIRNRFGFNLAKAQEYLSEYIENYDDLYLAYGPERADSPLPQATQPQATQTKAQTNVSTPSTILLQDSIQQPATAIKKRGRKPGKTVTNAPVKPVNPSPRGFLAWNAFRNKIKTDIETTTGTKVKSEVVMKRASEIKATDPIAYRLFTDSWLAENS